MEMPAEKPQVYTWFVVYCILMCLLVLVFGIIYPMLTKYVPEEGKAYMIFGPAYITIGLVGFITYVIAPFLKRTRGAWIYDLVLICLGSTSCCCLPITIPLLIFWIKPETKKYFGR